jgi:hypothetical protein
MRGRGAEYTPSARRLSEFARYARKERVVRGRGQCQAPEYTAPRRQAPNG